ncbi:hypothetical protein BH23VER1_BH23VER1_02060 [soil metagenome]
MKFDIPLLVVALSCMVLGCSSSKNTGQITPPDGADTVAGAEVPQSIRKTESTGRSQSGASGTAAPSGGSPYVVSNNLRNPTMKIPRVTAHSQVSISQASVPGKFVAMTFDDGPHPRNTPRLLDLLAQRNIKATFFVVGTNAKAYPDIMRRIVAEGHEIGNHTVNHGNLAKSSDAKVRSELKGAAEGIMATTGTAPRLMRPPYGAITSAQKQWIYDEFGYTTVMWSVDPRDWQRPGSSVVARRLVEGTRNGSILLAHDIHAPTIDAMPPALDELLRRGYQFVTVSQLMAMQSADSMGPPRMSRNVVPVPEPDADPTTGPTLYGPPVPSG